MRPAEVRIGIRLVVNCIALAGSVNNVHADVSTNEHIDRKD